MLIDRALLVKTLVSCLLILVALHFTVVTVFYKEYSAGENSPLFKLFFLDQETNLPSFFNTLLLLIAATIAYFIYEIGKKNQKKNVHWLFISLVFFFLGLDETISIHEYLNKIISDLGIKGTGYLRFTWIIPYSILALGFLMVSLRFLRSLPNKTRIGFILAGAIYVAGAVGCEMISAKIFDLNGKENFNYLAIVSLEEVLEMTGLIVFIHFQLDYMEDYVENAFKPSSPEQAKRSTKIIKELLIEQQ